MNRLLATSVFAAVIVLSCSNVRAQENSQEDLRAFGLGLTIGKGTMNVGDESESNRVVGLHARLGLSPNDHLFLMAEITPSRVASPVLEESFRAYNLLLALSMGKNWRLRPSVGLQFRSWSESEQVESSDLGPLFGIDLGYEFPVARKFSLSPELVARWSIIDLEGGVSSSFVGIQMVASWKKPNSGPANNQVE